jgi:hypothetical protein
MVQFSEIHRRHTRVPTSFQEEEKGAMSLLNIAFGGKEVKGSAHHFVVSYRFWGIVAFRNKLQVL